VKQLRVLLLLLAVVVSVSSLGFAQGKTNVIGSVHGIASAGCASCHAPHNGSVATGGSDQNSGKILLWDRCGVRLTDDGQHRC
jgi:hypothetical protein